MKSYCDCKYGCVALSVAIAEVVFIWGGLAIVNELGLWGHAPAWLERAFGVAYIGGLVGTILAVVGLVKDVRREYGAAALILGLFNLATAGFLFGR